MGKAIPEGVYDLGRNEGWVSVGVDHDTAEFAVASIRRWWQEMGSLVYPRARRLLITADAGGSSGYRSRLWKVELQGLADNLGSADIGLSLPARHEQVEERREKSSTACSATLRRTGAASRFARGPSS